MISIVWNLSAHFFLKLSYNVSFWRVLVWFDEMKLRWISRFSKHLKTFLHPGTVHSITSDSSSSAICFSSLIVLTLNSKNPSSSWMSVCCCFLTTTSEKGINFPFPTPYAFLTLRPCSSISKLWKLLKFFIGFTSADIFDSSILFTEAVTPLTGRSSRAFFMSFALKISWPSSQYLLIASFIGHNVRSQMSLPCCGSE